MIMAPPALLEDLKLGVGSTVSLEVRDNEVVLKPSHPKYAIEELLEGYEPPAERSAEEHEWLDSPPVRRELI